MEFVRFYVRRVGKGVILAEAWRVVVIVFILFWALMWFLSIAGVL